MRLASGWRIVISIVLAAAALVASGCSDSDPTSAPVFEADFTLVPDSVTAVPSADPNYDWMVSTQAVLTEIGGSVGATVDGLAIFVQESQNGIIVGGQAGDAWNLIIDAPSSRLEPNGTLTIGLEVFYALQTGATEAQVDVSILLTTDNGTVLTGAAQLDALP